MRKATQCPRCNITFVRNCIVISHTRSCNRVPTPRELAVIWIQNPEVTNCSLSRFYEVGRNFMLTRLKLAGLDEKTIFGRGNSKRGKTNRFTSKDLSFNFAARVIPDGKILCPGCELLIDKDRVLCEYCTLQNAGIKNYKQYIALSPHALTKLIGNQNEKNSPTICH